MRTLSSLPNRLFAPVDILSLVYFRIAFGAIMLWEVYRYFDHGWIPRYWINPALNFTYYGFDWVRPWGGSGMYLHWVALGALAILIILGLGYRISATLFFLGFTYAFLLEQARYLNHFYLICLISFLMIFIPAHRAAPLDALWRPSIRSQTAPAWALWVLRAQIGIAYFLRRCGQAERRLGPRRAVPRVAGSSHRLSAYWVTVYRRMDGLPAQLWRALVRPPRRSFSAVAPDALVCLRGSFPVSLDECADVLDRNLPLVHDRGNGPLFPAGLAPTPARTVVAGPEPWAP